MDGQDNNQNQVPPVGSDQQQQYNPYQQPQQPQQQYNPYQQPQQPYQQGYYQQPQQGYYQQPVAQPSNGTAVAAMVLGIVSLVFLWVWYIGLPAGIVGLILSIMAKKQGPNKMATAGLICSIIGLSVAAIVGVIAIIACSSLSYYNWY